jgi:hypothetical protein
MVKISPSHLDSCKCFHVSAAIGIGPPAIAIAAVIGAVATATTIFGAVTFLQITHKTHVDRKNMRNHGAHGRTTPGSEA